MRKAPLRIKVRASLPFDLESKLIQKYGFHIFSRLHGQYIIFEKNGEVAEDELDDKRKKQLLDQCERVVSFYQQPYNAVESIRQRLTVISQGLAPAEKTFIEEFMDEEFPVGGVQGGMFA